MSFASQPFLRTLAGQTGVTPPLWMMRQAGRYLPEYRQVRAKAGSFLDLCYNPELAAEVTLQPIHRFEFDAAVIFSDILVIPHALGLDLAFAEGEGPLLQIVHSGQEIAALRAELDPRFIEPVYEALRRVKKGLMADYPSTALLGFAGAPWTLATYMASGKGSADHREAKLWAYAEPEVFQELIDRLTAAVITHLGNQIEAGADAVQIFDSWGGELAPEQFEQWCLRPLQEIVAALREKHPAVPVICFPRAAGTKLARFVYQLPGVCVGLDTTEDRQHICSFVPSSCVLQGNLDPFALIAGGKALDKAVDSILADFAGHPFVFNLGHGIRPETPIAHVEQMIRRVRGQTQAG
jgi:uroporphyrinogen decarboxylase